jgi:hypothetical protein
MMPVELSDSVFSIDKSSLKNSDEIYRYRETSTFFFSFYIVRVELEVGNFYSSLLWHFYI